MTGDASSNPDDLRCIELVDRATAYLDGALNESDAGRIEEHLEGCQGCRTALEQLRTVIRITGRLTAVDVANIDPLTRDRLMATFRVPRRR
jgi:predicted anti-sigma-YlaC factor YlaD